MPLKLQAVRDSATDQNFRQVALILPIRRQDIADEAVGTDQLAKEAITDEKLASPVIRGQVSKAGAKLLGSGFTCEKTAAGKYTIKLTTELLTEGIMTATACEAATLRYVTVATSGKKEFTLEFRNQLTNLEDTLFNFMVVKS